MKEGDKFIFYKQALSDGECWFNVGGYVFSSKYNLEMAVKYVYTFDNLVEVSVMFENHLAHTKTKHVLSKSEMLLSIDKYGLKAIRKNKLEKIKNI